MKYRKIISLLVLCIAITAAAATIMGIFSNEGSGPYPYTSIRGKTVWIYGKGIYHHMSAEVAPQGIAQDYVTLCLGIPLLLIALYLSRKGSLRGRLLLTGTLGYFLVTYLFYLVMGMYNIFFLGYVFLLGASFFAFILGLLSFDVKALTDSFKKWPVTFAGGFLIFLACCIALLWLSVVVPPLLDGTIIPVQTEHYTTLIVQGLDLAILLPSAVISGILFLHKKPIGYLLAPVYYVFLSLLTMALTAKVIAMAILRYDVIPVIFIIPAFTIITIICTLLILKSVNNRNSFGKE